MQLKKTWLKKENHISLQKSRTLPLPQKITYASGFRFVWNSQILQNFYLVDTTVWVDSTASASTITFGQIKSDMEYKTKYSHTYGVNLKDFLYEIEQITGVNVPEPSTYAMILRLLALAVVGG